MMQEKIVTLGDVLSFPSKFKGWLFVEPQPWNTKSQCILVVFDKDADPDEDPVPSWIEEQGWIETIDIASIEDIIFNASAQVQAPATEQLVNAFAFYVENDAFIVF